MEVRQIAHQVVLVRFRGCLCASILACLLNFADARAQTYDIKVTQMGDYDDIHNYGSPCEGNSQECQDGSVDCALSAYSWDASICNAGTEPLTADGPNDGPVWAFNVYRLKDNRFEQIGMSWAKHLYGIDNASSECGTCEPPDPPENFLYQGCDDVYRYSFNGARNLFGQRKTLNPFGGAITGPKGDGADCGDHEQRKDNVQGRLAVWNAELCDPADEGCDGTIKYFGETMVFHFEEDEETNNQLNVVHREIIVDEWDGSSGGNGPNYELSFEPFSSTQSSPAILAWETADPEVTIYPFSVVSGDGEFLVGCKKPYETTGPLGAVWLFEYAVYNRNSYPVMKKFKISIPDDSLTITTTSFHDIDYHSGSEQDPTNWSVSTSCSSGVCSIIWEAQNPPNGMDRNTLRWGTLYNFRFITTSEPDLDVNDTIDATLYLDNVLGSSDTIAVCKP